MILLIVRVCSLIQHHPSVKLICQHIKTTVGIFVCIYIGESYHSCEVRYIGTHSISFLEIGVKSNCVSPFKLKEQKMFEIINTYIVTANPRFITLLRESEDGVIVCGSN